MSAKPRIVVAPPASPAPPDPDPPDSSDASPGWPDWRKTLRIEHAPTVLTAAEASRLLRLGTTPSPVQELLLRQRVATEHGNPPANPLLHMSTGNRTLIPNDALMLYILRGAGLTITDEEYIDVLRGRFSRH